MSITVTILTDNSVGKTTMLAEHGLSVLISTRRHSILFDTGQTFTATHNARMLGLELGYLDCIVLSHGHYDHTGGLKDVLRRKAQWNREVNVVAHPDIWSARYSHRNGERPRYIGIPFRREEMESLGAVFQLERGPVEVGPGIQTTGEVPRKTAFEHLDRSLVVFDGAALRQDDLLDDQALTIRTGQGLVIILGCAHSGIINTLNHARELTGEERIYAVIGGTHLSTASSEQIEETILALNQMGIKKLGASHCTGLNTATRLALEFGEDFFFATAGTSIELP